VIALDPLGAEVPGHDPARRIEREQRVVLHLLDYELEERRIDHGAAQRKSDLKRAIMPQSP